MLYKEFFSKTTGILIIKPAKESLDLKDFEEFAKLSFKKMEEYETDKVIFDHSDIDDSKTLFRNCNHAKRLMRLGCKNHYRIVIYHNDEKKAIDINRCYQVKCVDKGINIISTTSKEDGIKWLMAR